ncbi:MAG: hypothetical protein KIS79_10750 [Burkholderiales bacterium]|nr:hypothetical protein [Burkholderiales bacterium]
MTDKPRPTTKSRQTRPKKEKGKGSTLVPQLPKDEHEEELIDEALTETFPASDPISVPVPRDERAK